MAGVSGQCGDSSHAVSCVTEHSWPDSGDHPDTRRSREALCYEPATSTMLYVSDASKTNSYKEGSDLWLPEAGARENWMKVVKSCKILDTGK